MKKIIPAAIFIGFLLVIKSSFSQTINISFEQKATVNSPVDIVNAHDNSGRLFIVEQRGYVRILKNGIGLDPDTFLNIKGITLYDGAERGFLSLAFHPNYINNRFFFVYYNNLAGDVTIARYRTSAANPDSADAASGVVLMTIPKPFTNHNGGKLNFGPEGYLYFATGDGGSGGDPNNNSQNGNSLLGKMLRLNVDSFNTAPYYVIPPDNPFVSDGAVRDEIWALGLRNPWRWSFDRLNNDMWIADVGQGAWEEINYRAAGATGGINYGWRCYEGTHTYNTAGCAAPANYTMPIFEYPHNNTTGGFSVTGGYVYRGTEFPFFQGWYICSDYISGNGWLIKKNGSNFDTTQKTGFAAHITGYGEAEDGTLYAVSLDGPVYKVNAIQVIPLHLVSFSGNIDQNYARLSWQTENEHNTKNFEIQYSNDGQRFSTVATTAATNSAGTNNYSFTHPLGISTDHFYRLKMNDLDGNYSYSAVIKLNSKQGKNNWVYPTIIQNNIIRVYPSAEMNAVELFNTKGQLILKRTLNGDLYKEIPVTGIAKGLYILKLQSGLETVTQKIIIQ